MELFLALLMVCTQQAGGISPQLESAAIGGPTTLFAWTRSPASSRSSGIATPRSNDRSGATSQRFFFYRRNSTVLSISQLLAPLVILRMKRVRAGMSNVPSPQLLPPP